MVLIVSFIFQSEDSENDPPGMVPLPLLASLLKFLGKHSTKRLNHAKGAITLWLCENLIKNIPVEPTASSGKHVTCSSLCWFLFEFSIFIFTQICLICDCFGFF